MAATGSVTPKLVLASTIQAVQIPRLLEEHERVYLPANGITVKIEPLPTEGLCLLTLEGPTEETERWMGLLQLKYTRIFKS